MRKLCAFFHLPPLPLCANLAPSSERTQTNQTPQTHENQPLVPRLPLPRRSRHPSPLPTHPNHTRGALRHGTAPLVHRPFLAFAPLLSYSQSTTNHKPQTKPNKMKTQNCTEVSPAVYVGTFAKYTSGSIKGAWIKLEGHTAETFHAACLELHSDESDPELMFQDFEGFPRAFYGESALSPALWEWLDCNDSDQAIWEAFTECFGYSFEETTLQQALEAYVGDYDSPEAFAEEYVSDNYDLNAIPSFLGACIDWKAVWNSTLRFDFCEHNGCFFYSNH